jgi:hypothetical protein
VTELQEATLPDTLFQPPEGYQREESFPDSAVTRYRSAPQSFLDMLGTYWQMIKDWFSGKADH